MDETDKDEITFYCGENEDKATTLVLNFTETLMKKPQEQFQDLTRSISDIGTDAASDVRRSSQDPKYDEGAICVEDGETDEEEKQIQLLINDPNLQIYQQAL